MRNVMYILFFHDGCICLISDPQAHIGKEFRQAVDNGEFPNVEFVSCDGDADKYRIK